MERRRRNRNRLKLSKSRRSQAALQTYHKTNRNTLYVRTLWWISAIIFSSFAGFWVYKIITRYNSQPVTSIVSIKRNTSFEWPVISICPAEHCYDEDVLLEISKEYNLTVIPRARRFSFGSPFDLKKSPFDFVTNNYSNILQRAYLNRSSIIKQCFYLNWNNPKAFIHDQMQCIDDISYASRWHSHKTRYSPCHKFAADPATTIDDVIDISLDTSKCPTYYLAIHPASETYYRYRGSMIKEFQVPHGHNVEIILQVQEYNSINRKSSPCIEDIGYSESTCNEEEMKQQMIEAVGCYSPAKTGFPMKTKKKFFECNNSLAYGKLGRYELSQQYIKYNNKCSPVCRTIIYIIKEKRFKASSKSKSSITLTLAEDAMYFLHVDEEPAMTLVDFVGSVGGILGIFLGLSCFSLVSFAENYFIGMLLTSLTNRHINLGLI